MRKAAMPKPCSCKGATPCLCRKLRAFPEKSILSRRGPETRAFGGGNRRFLTVLHPPPAPLTLPPSPKEAKQMALINTKIRPFKAQAFKQGKFIEVTEADVL